MGSDCLPNNGTFVAHRFSRFRNELEILRGRNGTIVDLKNHTVNFRTCDIFYPAYQQVLFELHGGDILEGRVIDLSDSELDGVSFAEIELDDLEVRVIVPVDRILGICE